MHWYFLITYKIVWDCISNKRKTYLFNYFICKIHNKTSVKAYYYIVNKVNKNRNWKYTYILENILSITNWGGHFKYIILNFLQYLQNLV